MGKCEKTCMCTVAVPCGGCWQLCRWLCEADVVVMADDSVREACVWGPERPSAAYRYCTPSTGGTVATLARVLPASAVYSCGGNPQSSFTTKIKYSGLTASQRALLHHDERDVLPSGMLFIFIVFYLSYPLAVIFVYSLYSSVFVMWSVLALLVHVGYREYSVVCWTTVLCRSDRYSNYIHTNRNYQGFR